MSLVVQVIIRRGLAIVPTHAPQEEPNRNLLTVPVIVPVVVLIFKPDGKPKAVYDSVPLPESEAVSVTDTLPPSAFVWSAGLVRVTVAAASIVQVKAWVAT